MYVCEFYEVLSYSHQSWDTDAEMYIAVGETLTVTVETTRGNPIKYTVDWVETDSEFGVSVGPDPPLQELEITGIIRSFCIMVFKGFVEKLVY